MLLICWYITPNLPASSINRLLLEGDRKKPHAQQEQLTASIEESEIAPLS